jgi:SAM-dependent methyltransferase
MANTLEMLAAAQFGPQAQAYVASAVHSSGPDLDWIEAYLGDRGDATFIDVGCGGGHVAYRAAPHVRSVSACDPCSEMVRVVEATAAERGLANLRAVRGPAERLPFDDATFDIAATRFSAHHWGDLDAGLRDVARVLKPNGLFLVADSAAPAKPLLDTHLQAVEVLRDPSHVRNYATGEWVAAFGRSGFVVGEIRAARVRIEFGSWVERMKTPDVAVAAIRRLQSTAPDEVQRHFAIEADGSFILDTVWIEATTR